MISKTQSREREREAAITSPTRKCDLLMSHSALFWWLAEPNQASTLTSSYSMRERLLSSLTEMSVASSATSTRPHLSTASLIDPLYMSILALRRVTTLPSFIKSTDQKKELRTSINHLEDIIEDAN